MTEFDFLQESILAFWEWHWLVFILGIYKLLPLVLITLCNKSPDRHSVIMSTNQTWCNLQAKAGNAEEERKAVEAATTWMREKGFCKQFCKCELLREGKTKGNWKYCLTTPSTSELAVYIQARSDPSDMSSDCDRAWSHGAITITWSWILKEQNKRVCGGL